MKIILIINPLSHPTMSPMRSPLSILLLLTIWIHVTTSTPKCPNPQKSTSISYLGLQSQDTLPNLFEQINKILPSTNWSTTDSKGFTYQINNFHPQVYYNQHYQKQEYLSQSEVRVRLGDVYVGWTFWYGIWKDGVGKVGEARGRVLADQNAQFVKKFVIQDGCTMWNLVSATNISITQPMQIQYSQPILQFQQKQTFQHLLNTQKSPLLTSLNTIYTFLLPTHLKTQQLNGCSKVTYSYRNIHMDFVNEVKNFTIDPTKGLNIFAYFQLDGKAEKCGGDGIGVEGYGGMREVFGVVGLGEGFRYGLELGLADVMLDKSWEVPSFQFYMGDLANLIPHASTYPADDPIQVQCKWDKNSKSVQVSPYDDYELSAKLGQICTISYKSKPILQIQMQVSFVVTVVAQQDSLDFVITATSVYDPQYRALDPEFGVGEERYGLYAISRVLEGMVGRKTFGTGWKTLRRKFPAIYIKGDYLIIFDPTIQ